MALKQDFTKGNMNKQILFFALPIIVSNLFQALYNAVDMYFVGKYLGTEAIAGVAVAGPIMNILLMAVSGMALGVTILLGSLVSGDNEEKLLRTANTSISIFIVAAIIITLLGEIFSPLILRLIYTPAEAYGYALLYLRIVFGGMVFTLGYNLVCAIQRGFGDSKSSMYFVLASTLSNIVLDYIFIALLDMGVSGAAYATIISQALSFILSIVYFRSKKHIITFAPKDLCFDKKIAKEIIRIGLPNALQQGTVNIAYLVLNGIVNSYGLLATAAYGICVKLDSFAVLPCSAVNDAVASVTSQNLGVGQKERALKGISTGRKILIPFNICLMVLIFFAGDKLIGIFNTDPQVIFMAHKYIKISCFMYIFFAIYYPLMGFIKGTGNAMFSFKNTIVAQLLVRVPVAYTFAKIVGLGFYGVAISWIIAPIFSNTVYTVYLKSGKWYERLERQKKQGHSI